MSAALELYDDDLAGAALRGELTGGELERAQARRSIVVRARITDLEPRHRPVALPAPPNWRNAANPDLAIEMLVSYGRTCAAVHDRNQRRQRRRDLGGWRQRIVDTIASYTDITAAGW